MFILEMYFFETNNFKFFASYTKSPIEKKNITYNKLIRMWIF